MLARRTRRSVITFAPGPFGHTQHVDVGLIRGERVHEGFRGVPVDPGVAEQLVATRRSCLSWLGDRPMA